MSATGYVLGSLGGLLFAVAVFGKLDSWAAWSDLTRGFPGGIAVQSATRFAVPIAEAAVIVLCFTRPEVGLAAGAAALVVFSVGVLFLSRTLAGRECNCFGAIAPARLSPRLAMRNVFLALLAGVGSYVVSRTGPHAISAPYVLLTAVVAVALLVGMQVRELRSVAWPLPRMRGIEGR